MVAAEELDVEHEPDDLRHVDARERPALNTVNDALGRRPDRRHRRLERDVAHRPRIRAAAVAARAELLKLASTKLGVPVASLTVSKGVVSGGGKTVTYGELVGGKLLQRRR